MGAGWPYGALPGVQVTTDTRQQAGKHVHVDGWLDAHGVTHAPAKLDFGDYLAAGGNVSVDTKRDVEELCANVLGRGHDRFRRECERAQGAGYRLVVLVEGCAGVSDAAGLAAWAGARCAACRRCDWPRAWSCPRHRATVTKASRLVRAMATMRERYGVELMFCARRDTARTICELLGVRYDGDGGGAV